MTQATILDRLKCLSEKPSYAEFRDSGLGFHGTAETIFGPLRGGSYDNVFWTAETPSVAQSYIPLSGLKACLSWPERFRENDRVRPNKGSIWTGIIKQMGFDLPDVEYDAFGEVKSFIIKEGHPTYLEAAIFLEDELGYPLSKGPCNVFFGIVNGEYVLKSASYRKPGHVYVTDLSSLKIFDHLGDGDGDLTDPSHVKLALFRKIEALGYDGIRIGDFTQCGEWNYNVGHPSIGIFGRGLAKLEFFKFAAVHCDISEWSEAWTESYLAFPQTF